MKDDSESVYCSECKKKKDDYFDVETMLLTVALMFVDITIVLTFLTSKFMCCLVSMFGTGYV